MYYVLQVTNFKNYNSWNHKVQTTSIANPAILQIMAGLAVLVNIKMSFGCQRLDQNTNEIFSRISALASKKRLNQKLYYTNYVK